MFVDELNNVFTWEELEYSLCLEMETLNKILNVFM